MLTIRAKKVSFASAALFFLSAAGFAGALMFVIQQGNELVARAQAVADHNVRQQTYSELAAFSVRTATERAALQAYTLTEEATIDFLATIESVATAQGVTLETNTLAVTEGKPFSTLKVNVSVTGQEAAVRRVIAILETLPYPSTIERLNMVWGVRESDDQVSSTIDLAVSIPEQL